MQEQDREESGVSFRDIFRIIAKKIWFILGAAALATIVVVLLVRFVIDPHLVTYMMTFEVDYPNRDSLQYPDGTAFNYLDIVSRDMLEGAKASNPAFANIDIDYLLQSDALKITAEKEQIRDTGGVINEVYTGKYTIEANGNGIGDSYFVAAYLRAIGNLIVERINESVVKFDYSSNLDSYQNAFTYRERIDYLSTQKSYLLNQYDKLISEHGENYEVTLESGQGRTLRSYRAEVALLMDNMTTEALNSDLKNNGYLTEAQRADQSLIEVTIQGLREEREENRRKIITLKKRLEELYDIYSGSITGEIVPQFESFHSQISALTTRNVEINVNLVVLYASIGLSYDPDSYNEETGQDAPTEPLEAPRGNQIAFQNRLQAQFESLTEQTEIYRKIAIQIYEEESYVRFLTMRAESSGGVGILQAAIGTFLVVFLIGCVVVYAIFSKKNKNE